MRKKQKSETSGERVFTMEVAEAMTLPNSESSRLPLPIHKLWDEKRKAVTNSFILMRMEKWKHDSDRECRSSLPEHGISLSTMQ